METHAIFLDIDGTLLGKNGIPKENLSEIQRVRKQGHLVFLCTGRGKAYIPKEKLRSVPIVGMVAGLGTYAEYRGEVLLNICIPRDVLQNITQHFLKRGIFCVMEGVDVCYAVQDPQKRAWTVSSMDEWERKYADALISKITILYELNKSDHDVLKPYFTIIQHPSYAEGTLKGYRKSTGMEAILRHLNIPKERCVAMGDSDNDIDMLQVSGHPIAMGNANERVKKICEFVSCDASDGGVAMALKELFP